MRGTTRSLSLRRRLIADLMHASQGVPLITLRRTLRIAPLVAARAGLKRPPGYAAIFAKAFGLAARDAPILRTLYLKWPWARLYEVPQSVGMIAIARDDDDDGAPSVLFQKVSHLDQRPLAETDADIRSAKASSSDDIPMSRKLLRIAGYPLLLRRLLWAIAMNSGRQRANFAGTFGITSVAALGSGELHPLSPGPYLISYGPVTPEQTIDVVLRWDHRVADGALMAQTLARLEAIMNGEIVRELKAQAAAKPAVLIDMRGRSA